MTMDNPWVVTIVGGVVSSLIAAGILALFGTRFSPAANGRQIIVRLLKLASIAVIMIPVTGVFFSDEFERALSHWGSGTSFLIRGSLVLLIALLLVAVVFFGFDPFSPRD
ncbi:hypothetical protein ACFL09_04205 [Planctomycetota bacterium]